MHNEHVCIVNDVNLVDRAVAVLGGYGVRAVRRDSDELVLVADGHPGAGRMCRPQVHGRLTAALAAVIEPGQGSAVLVVAPFVTDSVAQVLRARGVDYVDLAGNVCLRGDGLLIDVRGRRPDKDVVEPRPRALNRPFTRSGAQVTFCLLAWPDLAVRPVRDIARISGVSSGSVHAVLRDLEAGGYLLTGSRGRVLARGGELLDRWVEAYALTLAATLHLGYYRAPDPLWWRDADGYLQAEEVELGGEAAAGMLDDRLRASTVTVYCVEIPARLLARYRCRRAETDRDANVIVRRRFWTCPEDGPDGHDGDGLVPPVLVYADLLVSGDPRQREHAYRLRTANDRFTCLQRS
jgi:hypothetical protein